MVASYSFDISKEQAKTVVEGVKTMVNFHSMKISSGSLNEASWLAEVTSFRFPRKMFFKGKLIFTKS